MSKFMLRFLSSDYLEKGAFFKGKFSDFFSNFHTLARKMANILTIFFFNMLIGHVDSTC